MSTINEILAWLNEQPTGGDPEQHVGFSLDYHHGQWYCQLNTGSGWGEERKSGLLIVRTGSTSSAAMFRALDDLWNWCDEGSRILDGLRALHGEAHP